MSDEPFFATYGRWNLRAFVESVPHDDVALVVFSVQPAAGTSLTPEQVGEVVANLWNRVRAELPQAAGHRGSWSELWFLVPGVSDASIEAAAVACSRPMESPADLWATFVRVDRGPEQRLDAIDDLGSALLKIEYRRRFPHALCVKNGSIVHRPA